MPQKKPPFQWHILLLFPAVLIYFEVVFRLSTVSGLFNAGTFYMLLFSLCLGGIGYLLSTMFKNRKWNRICAFVYLLLSALPYIIEYFIFRYFKYFFDLSTTVNGAGGVVTDFMGEILRMIFSFSGLLRIFLFLLPAGLYLFLGKKYANPRPSNSWKRIYTGLTMAILLTLGILGVSSHATLGPIMGAQYSFDNAVANFGLMPSLNLDIWYALFPSAGSNSGFDDDATIPVIPSPSTKPTDPSSTDSTEGTTGESTESTTEPTQPTEPPIVYTPNQLDIDFSALSASGDIGKLNEYVASLTASMKNPYTGIFEGKNLIMMTCEAFTLQAIDPELTPTLYRLATKGINFTDYYQQYSTGTIGGEYQIIFGRLPTSGGSSFKNAADNNNYYTMGSFLDRLGYNGWTFHNHSYTYYKRYITHNSIGYSNEFMGYGNGMEEFVDKTWPESDLQMIEGTMPMYMNQQPFNVYYMTVSGHSNYDRSGNVMVRKHWDQVKDLPYSDLVKGYLSTQLELEAALKLMVENLEKAGIADDTVICLTADHFPYGLDDDAALGDMPYLSELYGYNVKTAFQRDRNALIIWSGSLEASDPIVVDTPTSSLDILPTLANLFGVEFDSRLCAGRDVFSDATPLVFNLSYDWKTEYGTYYASSNTFTPTNPDLVLPDGYVDAVKSVVRNKLRFCKGVLDTDYYDYLFGE